MTTEAVIPSVSIPAIVAHRNALVEAAERIAEILRTAPDGFPRLSMETRDREEFSVAKVARIADRDGWQDVIEGSGMFSFMDHKAREAWDKQRDELSFPPLSEQAAVDMVQKLHADRGMMVSRGVAECFRRLCGGYKTNKADRFTSKLILTHIGSSWGTGAKWLSINLRACDDLDDLQRVLAILRGVPEVDYKTRGAYRLLQEQNASGNDVWPRVAVLPFFTVKVFKNGNGHLTFDHEADVLRLNKVLSIATGGAAVANGSERSADNRRHSAAYSGH